MIELRRYTVLLDLEVDVLAGDASEATSRAVSEVIPASTDDLEVRFRREGVIPESTYAKFRDVWHQSTEQFYIAGVSADRVRRV